MIRHIKVENFKSIPSLEMELGRINVFIGENGCGKTNILEAIALGSAAAADKLDTEFLGSRGLRFSSPETMMSGFSQNHTENKIRIRVQSEGGELVDSKVSYTNDLSKSLYIEVQYSHLLRKIRKTELSENEADFLDDLGLKKTETKFYWIFEFPPENSVEMNQIRLAFESSEVGISFLKKTERSKWAFLPIDKFLIYAPENHFLRRFEEETQIRPLGIRGEGLFKHLYELSIQEPEIIQKINEQLRLIDWFDGFEIPNDLIFTERRIRIRDRFMEEGLQFIDQYSSNEGFLYLLFYMTLIISDYTPKFFAIDNIDNALNPRLCTKLIEILVKLAKDHHKQIMLTAHNPGILDGLNLHDNEQRLFVASRNKIGHTNALRLLQKPTSNGHDPLKLSEQFLRGYIGGLPKNF